MRVLHLTLKKKWFDMIASGEKKQEYREIKPYWITRLANPEVPEFDYVLFTNGYRKDSPKLLVECVEIAIGNGKKEWGAESDKEYFVIVLGDIK
jgi:hypothetical protein